jgi:hypothetical protein
MPSSYVVLNLTVVLTNCQVVVVRFPKSDVVARLIGLPATGGKIVEMVAWMTVVKIAALQLDRVESS